LPPEIRDKTLLLSHLRSLGAVDFIDDEPKSEVGALVEMILRERSSKVDASHKPAAA